MNQGNYSNIVRGSTESVMSITVKNTYEEHRGRRGFNSLPGHHPARYANN